MVLPVFLEIILNSVHEFSVYRHTVIETTEEFEEPEEFHGLIRLIERFLKVHKVTLKTVNNSREHYQHNHENADDETPLRRRNWTVVSKSDRRQRRQREVQDDDCISHVRIVVHVVFVMEAVEIVVTSKGRFLLVRPFFYLHEEIKYETNGV